jgi:hypothetical protein
VRRSGGPDARCARHDATPSPHAGAHRLATRRVGVATCRRDAGVRRRAIGITARGCLRCRSSAAGGRSRDLCGVSAD